MAVISLPVNKEEASGWMLAEATLPTSEEDVKSYSRCGRPCLIVPFTDRFARGPRDVDCAEVSRFSVQVLCGHRPTGGMAFFFFGK